MDKIGGDIPIIGEKKPEMIITDEKALRKMSRPTSWKDIEEKDLLARLKLAVTKAWTPGVGLAAMQIGEYVRMAWFMNATREDVILVNPVIKEATMPIIVPKEGCLSIPDRWSQTKRYHEVTIRHEGREGSEILKFSGFLAIVVQHEIDHMNGITNLAKRYFPEPKVGRNAPCPCKSGKKYKKCCMDKLNLKPVEEKHEVPLSDTKVGEKRGLLERIKGLGRKAEIPGGLPPGGPTGAPPNGTKIPRVRSDSDGGGIQKD